MLVSAMLSVPPVASTEWLLKEMVELVVALEKKPIFPWFMYSRFKNLCATSNSYYFTNDQKRLYTNLVIRYNSLVAYDNIIDTDLEKPLIDNF